MSEISKPKLCDYKKWLKETHDVTIDGRYEVYYNAVANQIKAQVLEANIWEEITKNLMKENYEYYTNTDGYDLLTSKEAPVLLVKPYESFMEKTYRKNISFNKCFPDSPPNGWLLPSNWFSNINDVSRTMIVVKYLDGVKHLSEWIKTLCKEKDIPVRVFYEAREEGYYASHIYIDLEVEIPKMGWDTELIPVKIEIQVTTQLQEMIKDMLHQHYEASRIGSKKRSQKWQWDYKSDEFSANYLGHILHYLEGIIMNVRDKEIEDV